MEWSEIEWQGEREMERKRETNSPRGQEASVDRYCDKDFFFPSLRSGSFSASDFVILTLLLFLPFFVNNFDGLWFLILLLVSFWSYFLSFLFHSSMWGWREGEIVLFFLFFFLLTRDDVLSSSSWPVDSVVDSLFLLTKTGDVLVDEGPGASIHR